MKTGQPGTVSGAVSGGGTEPAGKQGRFGKLRAQSGFRMATIAFALTVVLGVGGTAAYAWWSWTKPVAVSGATGYSLPQPASPRCVTDTPNRVEWDPVVGADPEAKYVLTFQARGRTVSYAVPLGLSSVEPSGLSALRQQFGATFSARYPLIVTMRTAIVATDGRSITLIGDDVVDKARKSEISPPLQMFYSTTLWTNYPCH